MISIFRRVSWYFMLAMLAAAGAFGALHFLPVTQAEALPLPQPMPQQPEIYPQETENIEFPYRVPGSDLIAEGIYPYAGPYWEDGSDAPVRDVAAVMVRNAGEKMVEFGGIALTQGGITRYFFVYCLPPGERCLVLEKCRKPYSAEPVTALRCLNTYRVRQDCWPQLLKISRDGEIFTVQNQTDRYIATINLRYKRYLPEKGYYLGGICYSAFIPEMAPKGWVQLELKPSGGNMKIVTVNMERQ